MLPATARAAIAPSITEDRFTIVKDLKKEIKEDLLVEMCRPLGVKKADL